jgi:hypothetical protein
LKQLALGRKMETVKEERKKNPDAFFYVWLESLFFFRKHTSDTLLFLFVDRNMKTINRLIQ